MIKRFYINTILLIVLLITASSVNSENLRFPYRENEYDSGKLESLNNQGEIFDGIYYIASLKDRRFLFSFRNFSGVPLGINIKIFVPSERYLSVTSFTKERMERKSEFSDTFYELKDPKTMGKTDIIELEMNFKYNYGGLFWIKIYFEGTRALYEFNNSINIPIVIYEKNQPIIHQGEYYYPNKQRTKFDILLRFRDGAVDDNTRLVDFLTKLEGEIQNKVYNQLTDKDMKELDPLKNPTKYERKIKEIDAKIKETIVQLGKEMKINNIAPNQIEFINASSDLSYNISQPVPIDENEIPVVPYTPSNPVNHVSNNPGPRTEENDVSEIKTLLYSSVALFSYFYKLEMQHQADFHYGQYLQGNLDDYSRYESIKNHEEFLDTVLITCLINILSLNVINHDMFDLFGLKGGKNNDIHFLYKNNKLIYTLEF